MKIYLASTAPGNEVKCSLIIRRRLLSYYLLVNGILQCDFVFHQIKKLKHKQK